MKKQQHFVKQVSSIVQTLIVIPLFLFGSTTNPVLAQNWNEIIKTVASDRGAGDLFVWSVAISGDYAIVGVPYEDEDTTGGNTLNSSGAAYIFKKNAGTWSEVQKLVASDRGAGDQFGYSVSISGDVVIIGASYEDEDTTGGNTLSSAGAAYIFKNNAGTWSEVQKLAPADRGANDYFGHSVAISGNVAIIGAHLEDEDTTGGSPLTNAGSAYIFKNYAGTWSEVQKLVAADRGANDYFGHSVAISENVAIIGALFEDHDTTGGNGLANVGSAYIFKNKSGTWSEVQKLVSSDRGAFDEFGYSVAISGDFAIVGARYEDEDTTGGNTLGNAGAAYLFKNKSGTWSEVQKLVASDRGSSDRFGISVSILGDNAIIGALYEDEDTTGGNHLADAGSAYLFKNNAGTWLEVQKLVASDRGAGDLFGCSVAISGDYAIVGAPYEDEDTTGGNTLSNAGSAYIFKNCETRATDVQTACDSFTWIDGITYTSNNKTATDTLTNTAGCDSIVTLDLTINSVSDLSTTTAGLTITANNANATYQWLDCGNNYAIIAGDTAQTYTATANGNYAVELTENACVDTSACVAILSVGLLEESVVNELFNVYPNPSNGIMTVELHLPTAGRNLESNQRLFIYNQMAQVVREVSVKEGNNQINICELPKGVYFIRYGNSSKKTVLIE